MALQVNIPLQGGLTHNNGYVRVRDVRVCRKDNESDWFMVVDVSVYKDADERAKDSPVVIPCPPIDKFKFAYSVGDETGSNLVAHAYSKLKDASIFSGASDV
tara:strand:- start:98 stop:403 length:306 start_codon:yes stop_codon:yes gene_type:complete